MEFLDIYNRYAGQIVVGVFLIAVLVQYLIGLIEKKEIKRTKRCPHCSRNNLSVEISKTIKGGDKVSLLRNIGGGVVSLEFGALSLYQFYRLAYDWITGGKATGIMKESIKMKLALTGNTLIWGILLSILGILLIRAYFQKKEKSIILICNVCMTKFTTDGTVIELGEAKYSSPEKEIKEVPFQSNHQSISAPVDEPIEIPDTSETNKEDSSLCSKCHQEIETYEFTCPSCGHTQWELIGCGGVFSLIPVGFVIYRFIIRNTTGILFWVGVIVGVLLVAVVIQGIIQSVRLKR